MRIKVLNEMRKIYDEYGINIHSVPSNIQSSLNLLIKDFIKLKKNKNK